jgi:hypothetical protein
MCETPEHSTRSILQVALGFLLGIPVCLGCFFFSMILGGVLGVRPIWMFPLLNAIALVGSGMVALRRVNKSSYPEGVLIAISVAFVLNVVLFAVTLSRRLE